MPKTPTAAWTPANPEGLARQFWRLGWTGFWIQLVLFVVSAALVVYVVSVGDGASAARRGIQLGNYVSLGSTLLMLFTMTWCFLYTRLAGRIRHPERTPARSSVLRILWIGVWASALGIVSSTLLATNATLRLLFVLLATPQTGVPVVAPFGDDPVKTVSAIDALSLTALQLVALAELLVLALSLWLLFRVTRSRSAPAPAPRAAARHPARPPAQLRQRRARF